MTTAERPDELDADPPGAAGARWRRWGCSSAPWWRSACWPRRSTARTSTTDELTARAAAAVDWFTRNQLDDGTWLYEYDAGDRPRPRRRTTSSATPGRSWACTRRRRRGSTAPCESADRGREWIRQHLLQRDGWTAVSFEGRTTVGATALLVAGLVERRLTTGDTSDDDLIRWLARFLVAQTEPSGRRAQRLRQRDAANRSPVATRSTTPARPTGRWPGSTGCSRTRAGARRPTASATTSPRSRDDVEGYWPPIPDHWAAYGLAETVEFPERDPDRPLTDAELAHARRQAALFGSQVRWVSQQAGPWGSVVRGSFTPRGGGYGVVGEALTGLWLPAEADDRLEGIARADRRAGDVHRCPGHGRPARRRRGSRRRQPGAGRRRLVRRRCHPDGRPAARHLRPAAHRRRRRGRRGREAEATDDAPSGWLWVLAARRRGQPRARRLRCPTRRRPPGARHDRRAGRCARVGAALAAGLLAGPLLDALDVSAPAARIGVGIVGGVAGLVRMVRRPPSPEPALAGRKAAIVPVAVPLFATPAALLLAIGAGADLGLAVIAVAAVVAIAVLVAVTAALPPEGPGRRVVDLGGPPPLGGRRGCLHPPRRRRRVRRLSRASTSRSPAGDEVQSVADLLQRVPLGRDDDAARRSCSPPMQRCRRSVFGSSSWSVLRNQPTDLPGGVDSSTINRSAVSRRPQR